MLSAEPLTQPLRRVLIDGSVGRADLSQAEVVRPSGHCPVQAFHHLLSGPQSVLIRRHFADLTADAVNARLAWASTDIGFSPIRAVGASNPVAEELKRFLRTPQASGLAFVDRKPQTFHELLNHRQHVRRRGLAEHTEVIGSNAPNAAAATP